MTVKREWISAVVSRAPRHAFYFVPTSRNARHYELLLLPSKCIRGKIAGTGVIMYNAKNRNGCRKIRLRHGGWHWLRTFLDQRVIGQTPRKCYQHDIYHLLRLFRLPSFVMELLDQEFPETVLHVLRVLDTHFVIVIIISVEICTKPAPLLVFSKSKEG